MKSERGFSLIEVLVALGLTGLVSLGVMQINNNMFKGQKTFEMKSNRIDFKNNIMQLFSDKAICEETFVAGVTADPVGGTNVTNILRPGATAGTNIVVYTSTAGDLKNVIGDGVAGFKIDSMWIGNFAASGTPVGTIQGGTADFIVTLSKLGATADSRISQGTYGQQTLTMTFPLNVFIDTAAANAIQSCFSSTDAIASAICTSLGGTYENSECKSINIKDLDVPTGYAISTTDAMKSRSVYVGATPPGAPADGIGINTNPLGAGTLATSSDATIGGNLSAVDGGFTGNISAVNATMSGNVSATSGSVTGQSISSLSTLSVGTNLTVSGTSTLTGNVTMSGTLSVSGNTTLGGTLAVTNDITASSNIVVNGVIGDATSNLNRVTTKQWVISYVADVIANQLSAAEKQQIIDAILNQVSTTPLDTFINTMAARPNFQNASKQQACAAFGGIYGAGVCTSINITGQIAGGSMVASNATFNSGTSTLNIFAANADNVDLSTNSDSKNLRFRSDRIHLTDGTAGSFGSTIFYASSVGVASGPIGISGSSTGRGAYVVAQTLSQGVTGKVPASLTFGYASNGTEVGYMRMTGDPATLTSPSTECTTLSSGSSSGAIFSAITSGGKLVSAACNRTSGNLERVQITP